MGQNSPGTIRAAKQKVIPFHDLGIIAVLHDPAQNRRVNIVLLQKHFKRFGEFLARHHGLLFSGYFPSVYAVTLDLYLGKRHCQCSPNGRVVQAVGAPGAFGASGSVGETTPFFVRVRRGLSDL